MPASTVARQLLGAAIVACTVSASAVAAYVGPSDSPHGPGVSAILQKPVDEQQVTLQGYLLRKTGHEKRNTCSRMEPEKSLWKSMTRISLLLLSGPVRRCGSVAKSTLAGIGLPKSRWTHWKSSNRVAAAAFDAKVKARLAMKIYQVRAIRIIGRKTGEIKISPKNKGLQT